MHTKTLTMNQNLANDKAAGLLACGDVLAVQLFGSVARGTDGYQSDIDLIVICDSWRHDAWMKAVGERGRAAFETDSYFGSKESRREEFERFFKPTDYARPIHLYGVDIFVFPSNWRETEVRAELQKSGGHSDPEFINKVAADAITYDPFIRSFPWKV